MVNFDEILESGEVVEETPPTIQEPLDIDDIINNGEVVENTPAPKDISNETIAGIRDTRDLDQAMRVSKGNLSWALNVTQDIQPEKAREIESIAKSLKMPSTTVESDLEMARKYKRNKEIVDNIFKVDKDIGPLNPATLQFFTDPNNARLYKDEAERMVEIESIAKNHSKKLRDENSGVLTNFGKSALSGSLELVKGALLFPKFFSDRLKIQGEELEDQRQQLFQEIGVDIKQPKGGKIIEAIDSIMPTTPTGLATQIAGRNIIEATNKSINYLTDELINGQLVDYAQKVGSVATNINPEQATRSITRLIGDGRYKDAIETTFLQAAGSIPSMVLMGVAGVNGLSAIGGVTAADEYNIAVEEGVDGKTAMAVGTIKGGAEAIFELPTLSLLNAFKKTIAGEVAKRGGKEVAKRIAKSFLSEGSSEAATTVTQNLADLLTDREVKPLDVTLQAIDAFIVGGFVGTAVGSLTESVSL